MEWIEGLNKSIDYIESNLEGEIEIGKAAQLAMCSAFHYHRMFAYITGISLTEYIRRRRMTLAAFEMINGDSKVMDLALKYGYESPTAFNRAFKNVHGISPSKAKAEGIQLTAFPRLTFTLSVKGEVAMNYRIVKKDSFRVVGYVTKEEMTMEDSNEKIPKFWDEVDRDGGIEKLCALADGEEPGGILGLITCEGDEFSGYYVAVTSKAPVPEGMVEYVVPATTYAVFECIGAMPEAIQKIQNRILTEWLPTSGYDYAAGPDIEVYPEGDQESASYYSEVWLPIIKKGGERI